MSKGIGLTCDSIYENVEVFMPDSTSFIKSIFKLGEENFLYFWEISGGVLLVIAIFFIYFPYYKQNKKKKRLKEKLDSKFYSSDEIEHFMDCYVFPNCQSFDPFEDPQKKDLQMNQELSFKRIKKFLSSDSHSRRLLLLADPGMGKTAFILNYYSYNQQLPEKKRDLIEVVPLNSAEADQYISQIPNKQNTILFLDGFDEDVQAIPDRRRRVKELMEQCQIFKGVLITCCKQYFPGDETDWEGNGIIHVQTGQKTTTKDYQFWKIYLLPLQETQIQKYLWKRYPLWRWLKHKNAQKLLSKFPLLTTKPIFLTYLAEFFQSSSMFNYSYQLYEELIDRWLIREEKRIKIDSEPLRKFLERLAIESYRNSEQRGTEKMTKEETADIAKKWEIPLHNLSFQDNSLLTEDISGYCKFTHRSIMEYIFTRQLLNYKYNHPLWKIRRTALMTAFLIEKIKSFQNHHSSTRVGRNLPVLLRYHSIRLNDDEAKFIVSKQGRIPHLYQVNNINNDVIVTDYATNLIWEQSGSPRYMRYKNAASYIKELNRKKFAGYGGWRLPTLEEAITLAELKSKDGGLYIDPLFDSTQRWIWTADLYSTASRAWCMDFGIGNCSCLAVGLNGYVRAVRSRYYEH